MTPNQFSTELAVNRILASIKYYRIEADWHENRGQELLARAKAHFRRAEQYRDEIRTLADQPAELAAAAEAAREAAEESQAQHAEAIKRGDA
jgi:translation initiation factor 2B subunit (eIF-2B alpha/beta/delta family)